MVCNAVLQVSMITEMTIKSILPCALRAQKADTSCTLPLEHANTLRVLFTRVRRKVIFHGLFALCCHYLLLGYSMKILNDPNDGTQECEGRCLTFLQKRSSPLQSHQRCVSKASLELESDCRKGIFATLTLTLPIQ